MLPIHIAWMNTICISDDNQGNQNNWEEIPPMHLKRMLTVFLSTLVESDQFIVPHRIGIFFLIWYYTCFNALLQNWYWIYHIMYKIELIFLFALKFLKALQSIIGMVVLFWINFFSEGRFWGGRKLTFNEQLPYARHFIYAFSFNSHYSSENKVLLLSPFYSWQNKYLKKLSSSFTITLPLSQISRTHMQALTPKPVVFIRVLCLFVLKLSSLF